VAIAGAAAAYISPNRPAPIVYPPAIVAGKAYVAAGIRKDGVPIPAEVTCTARRASNEQVRMIYEMAFLGEAQVPSTAVGETWTRELVDTYVGCGGSPRDILEVNRRDPDKGLVQFFAAGMALADR
jgi:hypothetical protein